MGSMGRQMCIRWGGMGGMMVGFRRRRRSGMMCGWGWKQQSRVWGRFFTCRANKVRARPGGGVR